jgi:hypothetical protein
VYRFRADCPSRRRLCIEFLDLTVTELDQIARISRRVVRRRSDGQVSREGGRALLSGRHQVRLKKPVTVMDKTALVLGATGGIGGETAAALIRHGWTVRALARNPAKLRPSGARDPLAGATFIAGDATDAKAVRRAAEGVNGIVHAVSPPGYRGWGKVVLPMIDSTIAAAEAVGVPIVLPGTIYNYGPDAFPDLREDSPQHAPTEKGRIRVELEKRLEAASGRGVPVLIVRFGDFFGPVPGNNWFSQGLITPGMRPRAITYPGPKGVGVMHGRICPTLAKRSRSSSTGRRSWSRSRDFTLQAFGIPTVLRWRRRSPPRSVRPS